MHCNSFKQDNYSTVGGDGDVGSARYEPALLPPCPTIRVYATVTVRDPPAVQGLSNLQTVSFQ